MKISRTALILPLLLAACADVIVPVRVPVPMPMPSQSSVTVAPSAVPSAAPSVGEDQHYVQADDWFIADAELTSGWQYVYLAKRAVAPSASTKMQGKYFQLSSASDVWTAYAWQTRVANTTDLRVGASAFCFEGRQVNDAYGAPTSKDDGRTGNWFRGRITDTSDAFKGVYRIDSYNCHVSAIRVAR